MKNASEVAAAKGLKIWNGVMGGRRYYICAKSRAHANRLLNRAHGKPEDHLDRTRFIRDYFHEGCWGVRMDGIDPEVGVWALRDDGFNGMSRDKIPERIL